jgi:AraC-like DNA-binding protein
VLTVNKYHPSALLAPFVKEYILIHTDQATTTKTIPNTSLVLSFRLRGNVTLDGNVLPDFNLAGIRCTDRQFTYEHDTANLLVLLKEGGLTAFSKLPAHETFESNISLDNIFPAGELRSLAGRLCEEHCITEIESFLSNHLHRASHRTDALTIAAATAITKHGGKIPVQDLADELYISIDPFEKRFRALVGCSPKKYASIIRLRNLITQYTPVQSLTNVAYEAGYFDQSHFIKDFKRFTGTHPKAFFKLPAYW